MNYWLLTTEYPPFFGGGISTYCYFTAKMLVKEGHQVSVFVNDASIQDVVQEEEDNLRVIRFNPARTGSSSFLGHVTNLSYEFAHIVKDFILKDGKPDVIEAQEYLGIAYYLLQYKHLQYDWCKNITVLITMHSPAFLYLEYNHVPTYKYPNYWIGEMERFCIQAADVVISPSQFLLTEVEKRFNCSHSNFYIVPNPYELKERREEDQVTVKQEDIIFFGKLSAQKGTFHLLRYFKELWENGFSEALYLVGGQDIVYHPEGKTMGDIVRKKYKGFIAKGILKLEKQISPAEISRRLASAKVVIVPSTVDNLPYVVMEMMSLGLVVLVSKQGGQAEIITDGTDGFIFDHEQPDSFVTQLNRILKLTDAQRAAIGTNAIKRIRDNYSSQKIYKEKVSVIEATWQRLQARKLFPFIRPAANQADVIPVPRNGLLSVVIPYYNMGKYIDETIASVKNSEAVHKEIIIVNDGSTEEESLAKLLPYRNDLFITVLDVPNQGLASARNIGAEKAEGQYLAFLDADDKIAPDYYKKSINVLEQYDNVHFVGAWTQYFEDSNKVWPTFTPEPPLILFHNLVNSSSLVYKRSSFLAAGKNDKAMPFPGLEDYDSVIAMQSKGLNGVVLPEILFYYRVRKDSMIRGVSPVKKLILYDYLGKKHKNFYATFATDVFCLTNANGTGTVLDNPSLDLDLLNKLPFNNHISRELISLIKRNKHLKKLAYRAYSTLHK
ncbi:MAG: glycosyltransferase [Nitrospirota bacterium]